MIFLVLVSAVLFYVLFREEMKSREALSLMADTSKRLERIDKSLGNRDLQKAYGDLHEAQKKIVAFLKAPAEKPEVKELVKGVSGEKKAAPAQATVSLPDLTREIPYPFVHVRDGENLLVCEKETKTLMVFRKAGGQLSLVKAYPCLIGANQQEKRKGGDLATPVGSYFFVKFIPGKSLAENYGYGAFVLNYPNFLDRRESKEGTGIWLHGHNAGKSFGDEIVNTKGCIVVSNDALKEMSEYLKASGTAIVVVNKLAFTKTDNQGALAKELTAFVDGWRRAWESKSVPKYMSYYAPEFISAEGMGYQAFKKHKEKVNKGKAFIRVATENLMILLPQEKEGQYAVARFNQNYVSSNFKSETNKILYMKKGSGGWHIVGESSF